MVQVTWLLLISCANAGFNGGYLFAGESQEAYCEKYPYFAKILNWAYCANYIILMHFFSLFFDIY